MLVFVPDESLRERVFGMVVEEFERTKRVVLRLTGQTRLLEKNPVLARSIRLRNPYVDPLSLISGGIAPPQARRRRRRQSGLCAGRDYQRHRRWFTEHWLRGVPGFVNLKRLQSACELR